jgi:catechol 2,3-dioxygenase
MTQINGFIAPTRRPGELGVHSLDHFSLTVPDLSVAEKFYGSFGLNVRPEGSNLALRQSEKSHVAAVITEGPRKGLRYISFGCFEEDFAGFRDRLDHLGIRRLDPPAGFDSNGLWFRDDDGNLVEIRVCEKTSPSEKSAVKTVSSPAGVRGVPKRVDAGTVRPRRLSHVLLFTTDVNRAYDFYHRVLGLRLSDRSGDVIAFMHGIHGSDHHMLAVAKSSALGFHHVSWGVDSIHEVGLGAMQMADRGFSAGWGTGRHMSGSNYFHYVRDPWGSYCEYSCDIDFIASNQDWQAYDLAPEDSVYLWGPPLPEDFIVNHEAQPALETTRA